MKPLLTLEMSQAIQKAANESRTTQSLLTIDQLSHNDIFTILDDAKCFSYSQKDWHLSQERLVANLFFEPSTRTHYSFISAEEQLGMKVANFNPMTSSQQKGESLSDTARTFEAIGYDALVIRHGDDDYYKELDQLSIPIINAGSGKAHHPTQCLLDLFTIYDEFQTIAGLNVLIVGDIKHSRVASSNITTLERLGANVKVSGPTELQKDGETRFEQLDNALEWADVVMMLRIQFERHEEVLSIEKEDYLTYYGLTKDRAARLKDHAIIMHPAPMNRGIEIDSDVVEFSKSRIFKQMENGVYTRKAILKYCLGESF